MFGVEDSLVSTLGALTGIAAGTQSTYVVVLAGVVLIFAEAVSMTAGSYLSSKAEGAVWLKEHADDWHVLMKRDEAKGPIKSAMNKLNLEGDDEQRLWRAIESQRKRWLQQVVRHVKEASPAGTKYPILSASVMGVSYLSAGIIPLMAYLFLPVEQAIMPAIVITFIALFAFGAWSSTITQRKWWRAGLEMLLVAGTAAGVGYVLGLVTRMAFGVVL